MQAELAVKLSKLQMEKDFSQQTSESLLRDQDDFRTQLAAEQTKSQAKDAQIIDLTEQVCTPFAIISSSQQAQHLLSRFGNASCMGDVAASSTYGRTCLAKHSVPGGISQPHSAACADAQI